MSNRTLPQIAKAIKALEKKSIQTIVEIGKLLHEAAEKCEHGEYREWLKAEFDWSHDTARNYRNVYDLAQKTKFSSFDICASALYIAAACLKSDDPVALAAGEAILEAAKQGRVSYQIARDILRRAYEAADDAAEEELPQDDTPEQPDDSDTPEQHWQSSLASIAGDSIALQASLTRQFGDWEKFEVPSELAALIQQAANAWMELALKLVKTSSVKAAADRAEAKAKRKEEAPTPVTT